MYMCIAYKLDNLCMRLCVYTLFLLSVIVYVINRYQNAFPGIDIFVCTEDPMIELHTNYGD